MFNPDQHTSVKTAYLTRLSFFCLGAGALVWLLNTGTPVFLPLMCALMAGVVFAPLADFLDRAGAPRVFGALLVLFLILATVVAAVIAFYPIIAQFIHRLPLMWYEIQTTFSGLKATMDSVENAQNTVAQSLGGDGNASEGEEGMKVPGIRDVLAYLPSIAAQIMIFVGILYFFLLTRSDIYDFIDRNTQLLGARELCRAEAEVSKYFLTITAINGGFATLVTMMLLLLEMPNAIYWGVAAFFANFILYLGPICFAMCLAIGGIIAFDGPVSFAPPVLFLLMNMIEGQFVTPSLVGRHMSVNPLLVFLSLVFFMWLWGPLGGIIAIPILVWLRQMNKAVEAMEDAHPDTPPAAPQPA